MIDERRVEAESERHVIGRVVDEEKLEDKSLLWLASSTSNISVRWQQGRFIGAGAFGYVYLAINLDTGGLMAAKEIRFQDVNSLSTLLQQIQDELSVMEILQHPNIVEYYGIEVHREKVFIFEEYCQGGSIASLLEHGRIEDETVLQVYAMQMLDGLAYLHSKGVVHRDVKPESELCVIDANPRRMTAFRYSPGPYGSR
jgi:mitogen-activated protein kinase kinase kinase